MLNARDDYYYNDAVEFCIIQNVYFDLDYNVRIEF